MPTPDEDFVQKLRATFKVEAEEHLQVMATMLLALEKSAYPSPGDVETVYREAHSLKGAARAVDFADIEAICQAVEGVFSAWKRDQSVPSPQSLDAIHHALDDIHALLEPPSADTPRPNPTEWINQLGRFHVPPSGPTNFIAPPPPPQSPPQKPTAPPWAPPEPAPPAAPAPEPEKSPASQTVRIPIDKLDARLLQAEDMLAVKMQTAQRSADLVALAARFEPWRKQWAKVAPAARALRQSAERQSGDTSQITAAQTVAGFIDWNFDFIRVLENQLLSIATQSERDRHTVAKRVDDLLEESKKMLMLPFSTIAGLFPKVVRDLCRDQNKEAELVIQGGEVEIDKRILEEMKDVLIHALRNCVDHGIESPAERARQNKPARATIQIAVSPVSANKVEISVTDDGAGIDADRVKDSAVRHGILSAADARALSDADALALVFHSEVSTRPTVTTISGRGLGMAIVRAKTEKLGGRASIQSTPHAGATLRILLPLTLATFRGLLVTAAERSFIIPTSSVERAIRLRPADIQTVENRESITLQGRALSLVRLESVLALPPAPQAPRHTTAVTAVVLHFADQRIAFVVDEVVREEEILVKPLRKPLLRVRNIAGATVLASGNAVPILNVADLIQSARCQAGSPRALSVHSPAPAPASKRILVVEDSITSRMLLKGILESAGYQVQTAVDGVDAFMILREHPVDLVVSDVEMPRMNGLDLAGRIRADKRLSELPVVLVSALESRTERERGIDAGASAYIVKSSFDQTNLLEAIRRLV